MNKPLLVAMLALTVLNLTSILTAGAYDFFRVGMFLPYLGCVCALIVRRRLRPRKLILRDQVIELGEKQIHITEIACLYIDRHDTVGVKLHRSRIVPASLSFEFVDRQAGDEALTTWAAAHDITLHRKPFMRWI